MRPPPTATVGMIGAGQLARMSLPAAIALGVDLRVLAGSPDDAAALVAPHTVVGDWHSLEDLRTFAAGCDVVTFDHELVDAAHLRALAADGVPLAPPPEAKRFAQDKRHQRVGLAAAGLPVPVFADVGGPEAITAFGEANGWPVVVKSATGGYDGRGVWFCDDPGAARAVWEQARRAAPLLAEAHVELAAEVAVLTARTAGGEAVTYPPVETVQRDGICIETLVPARLDAAVVEAAAELGRAVAETVGAVGVCAVELFVERSGAVLVNELALRPHNSGHWSIEGASTNQFANHLRGVLGWPPGSAEATGPAVATVNVLGPPDGSDPAPRLPAALAVAGAHVHLYGKAARPGRKLGHVTVVGGDAEEVLGRAREAAARLTGEEEDRR